LTNGTIRVLILGGGDPAVDWALNLIDYGKTVTLIHRRDRFRALKENVAQMIGSGVVVKTFASWKEVLGRVEDGYLRLPLMSVCPEIQILLVHSTVFLVALQKPIIGVIEEMDAYFAKIESLPSTPHNSSSE